LFRPKAVCFIGFMSLTINNINVTDLLKDHFSRLNHGWMTLLQVPVERTMDMNIEALKTLQDLGYEGIYITLSKDYVELSKIFREKNIDMGKIAFVDGVSQMYGIGAVDAPNVKYISGPISLDGIVAAITDIIPVMKSQKKFVFLDSITTVLLYNSLERTLKFSEFLTSSLKRLEVAGVMVSVSKGFANDSLLKELTKMSNEVIKI
jgi:KaiC/GvpD/RAD55 family RecA-like ATPase